MTKRSLIVAAIVAAFALAVVPAALAEDLEDGVEVTNGSGHAILQLRGAALGEIGRGRIVIVPRVGTEPEFVIQGYEWSRQLDRGTVYGGEHMRFRFKGAGKLSIYGSRINASAVGIGTVTIEGTGEFSLGGGPYAAWPPDEAVIELGHEPE
jgi:hypothetical protein